jgi:hypothetical protein
VRWQECLRRNSRLQEIPTGPRDLRREQYHWTSKTLNAKAPPAISGAFFVRDGTAKANRLLLFLLTGSKRRLPTSRGALLARCCSDCLDLVLLWLFGLSIAFSHAALLGLKGRLTRTVTPALFIIGQYSIQLRVSSGRLKTDALAALAASEWAARRRLASGGVTAAIGLTTASDP